jgi:glycosyltransferase involved in cell wall biosynthesis
MTRPYFSVVTPSWNQGSWIEGCIKSVLSQGVTDFEHIVLDNCSSDETEQVLARYPHLHVIRRGGSRPIACLEQGIPARARRDHLLAERR